MKTLIGVLVVFSVALCGCERLTGPGPEKVVTTYLEAQKAGNWEAAHALLSASDRATTPAAEYGADARENPFLLMLLSRTKYKVLSVQKDGGRAVADVEMSAPDLSGPMADLMTSAFSAAFSGRNFDDLKKQLDQKMKDGTYPTKTSNEKFSIVREDDGWRVFLDLAVKKQVATLSTEAESLRKKKRFPEAAAKYDAILKVDAKNATAIKAKEELTRDIAANKERQDYIQKIELYDLGSKYYSTFLDGRIPGVEFKLRNRGDKTLRRVQVTVYFTDQAGAVIAEKEYLPVLVSEFSRDPPLRPNYIWQLERGKFLVAKSVPSEWKEGSATAKITDVEFEK